MKAVLQLLTACFLIMGISVDVGAEGLRCSKIKDPQAKTEYVTDIRGITAEEGCTIKVPATLVCVPATTTEPVPPAPGPTSSRTSKGFACYQTKCPKVRGLKNLPNVRVDDQYGDRAVTPKPSKLLCVPVDTPIFSCGDGPLPQCNGTCPSGQVCVGTTTITSSDGSCLIGTLTGTSSCGCVDTDVACAGAPCPSRLCGISQCPAANTGCDDCKRPGGTCTTDDDCCFGSCDPGLGGLGQCVDERGRTAAAP